MTTIHPQWQTTDDDDQPVSVSAAEESIPQHVPRARRSPAAIVGILIFFGLGFTLFQGAGSFGGQLTDADVTISLTENAVDPSVVTVQPGQTILWQNNGGIPHILTSETLRDDEGKTLETSAIFPGTDEQFTIPLNTVDGTYDYISQTSAAIQGQIIVERSTVQANSTISRASSNSVGSQQTVIPSVTSVSSSSSSVQVIPTPATEETIPLGSIPRNPYTVGSTTTSPTVPAYVQAASVTFTQHTPVEQPKSGVSAWLLLLIGMGTFGFVSWRALRHL